MTLRLAPLLAVLALAGCAGRQSTVTEPDARPSASATPTPGRQLPLTPLPSTGSTLDPADRIGITLTVDDWIAISATTEDITSVGYESGLDIAAGQAQLIEAPGERLARDKQDKHYLPDGTRVKFTYTRAQWTWIADQLTYWAGISDNVDIPEDATADRHVATTIRRRLAVTAVGPHTAATTSAHYRATANEHVVALSPWTYSPPSDSEYGDPDPEYPLPDDPEPHVVTLTALKDGSLISLLTGRPGPNVDLTVRLLDSAPAPLRDSMAGWDVGEEVTASIRQPLSGTGGPNWNVDNAIVPGRPGLFRVRVLARDRLHTDTYAEDDKQRGTERFDVTLWPVTDRQPNELIGDDTDHVLPEDQER